MCPSPQREDRSGLTETTHGKDPRESLSFCSYNNTYLRGKHKLGYERNYGITAGTNWPRTIILIRARTWSAQILSTGRAWEDAQARITIGASDTVNGVFWNRLIQAQSAESAAMYCTE